MTTLTKFLHRIRPSVSQPAVYSNRPSERNDADNETLHSHVPVDLGDTETLRSYAPREAADNDTLYSFSRRDDCDNDTLYSVAQPSHDELRQAPHLLARWQPGDKQRYAQLMARLDEMQDEVISKRNYMAIKTARGFFGEELGKITTLPEETMANAKESLACCIADAFCRWSTEKADLTPDRGMAKWQTDYYRKFRRPLRVYGTLYLPDNEQSRIRLLSVDLKHNLESLRGMGRADHKPKDETFVLMTEDRFMLRLAEVMWEQCGKFHNDIMTLEERKTTGVLQGRKALFMDLAGPL